MCFTMQAQNDIRNEDSLIASYKIKKIIKLKKRNKKEQIMLIDFEKMHSNNDNIFVEEYQNYYKLIVGFQSVKEDFTGGAVCFKMNKKTGEFEMIWNEHPMKLPKLEIK